MLIVGLILAGLAAALHVSIFWLESIAWTGPRARAVFGTTEADARTTRRLAFNQGFYNLFLAVLAAAGIIVTAVGAPVVGVTLVLAGTGSMTAAALVLLVSSPDTSRAALTQGTIPVLAVIAVVIGLFV